MSRYLEVPVSGPLDRIAARAHLAFKSIGRVSQYVPESHVRGTIRCNGVNIDFRVSWKETQDAFLLDLEASTAERLYSAADRALYDYARAYKAVIEEERELAAQGGQSQDPWYRKIWPRKKG